jgi:hypothetical protein
VTTTLSDLKAVATGDLAGLYRAPRTAELDLRSPKRTLPMKILRGKTPDVVRKDLWAGVLAYSLIRRVMAQAAAGHGLVPQLINFTGTMKALRAFRPLLERRSAGGAAGRLRPYRDLLDAIAAHRVGDRPDRYGPRVKKRAEPRRLADPPRAEM